MPLEYREQLGRAVLVDLSPARDRSSSPQFPYVTMSEVRAHHSRTDLWIVIDNNVYDLTRFVDKHPGGPLALSHAAGHECTDLFTEYHPASTWVMMAQCGVGDWKR